MQEVVERSVAPFLKRAETAQQQITTKAEDSVAPPFARQARPADKQIKRRRRVSR